MGVNLKWRRGVNLHGIYNRLLDQSESKHKRLGRQSNHLLAGYTYCSCGNKMYVFHETKSNTYSCKKCKSRIAETDLDEIYHDQLKAFLLTDINVSDYLSKIDETIIEKSKLLESLSENRTNLKKKMDKFIDMRINEEMDKQNFADRYKPLEKQFKQINDQIPELEAEIDFLKIEHQSSDVVLQEAKDLYSQWHNLEYNEKRAIVELITDKITIGKEDIHIKLAYLPHRNPPAPQNIDSNLNPVTKQRDFMDS